MGFLFLNAWLLFLKVLLRVTTIKVTFISLLLRQLMASFI